MFEWITGLVRQFGYAGVALLTFLENVAPTIPSELIMPLAGFVARWGELGLMATIIAGTLGSLVGAVGWYVIGRRVGEKRIRVWVDRHGRWLGLSGEDIDRSASWFRRHGAAAVLFGRLVPGVRTFVSVPAGVARMRTIPFLLYALVGTAAWTAALTYAGYLLGSQYGRISGVLDVLTWIVLAGFVVAYVMWVVRIRRKTREED